MSEIWVVGAGGHAKVVVATLQAAGHRVTGCLDDDPLARGRTVLGVPVVGTVERLAGFDGRAVLGIGSNALRNRVAQAFPDVDWMSVVHPSAIVHPTATLGVGAVVFAGVVVQPDAHLGAHAILNTAASVDHDSAVGDAAHLAPGARLAGGVTIGEGTLIGIGASVAPGCTVGAWSVVGAGAAVARDVPANVTAVGVPARVLKERPAGWHTG